MKFRQTKLAGVYIVRLEPNTDERGYFMRTFCQKECLSAGIEFSVVQANRSLSKIRGSVRGMHYQKEPFAEDKLISCIRGKIFDVALDLRKPSKTRGQWIGTELSQDNDTALFIPRGCAHGFQTIEPDCEVEYLMSQFYSPQHASGVRCTDPFFAIRWPLPITEISEKDTQWPLMEKG